jgi:hypothetical protein
MTTINPKMATIVAKLDAAKAISKAAMNAPNAEKNESAVEATFDPVWGLEDRLAKIAATNLDELKIKARYADVDTHIRDALTESIIRDLRALEEASHV